MISSIAGNPCAMTTSATVTTKKTQMDFMFDLLRLTEVTVEDHNRYVVSSAAFSINSRWSVQRSSKTNNRYSSGISLVHTQLMRIFCSIFFYFNFTQGITSQVSLFIFWSEIKYNVLLSLVFFMRVIIIIKLFQQSIMNVHIFPGALGKTECWPTFYSRPVLYILS